MIHRVNPADLCILVVEDQEFQRSVLLKMVARLGATRLLEAADGAEAFRVLQQADCRVDVVISDLDMPGMDGFEFMRRLACIGRAPAVIVMSAIESAVLASVEPMAQAYGIRLLGMLSKPISQQRLAQLLECFQAEPTAAAAAAAVEPVFGAAEIEAGLARDEFEPWFQPKVELSGGRVAGFEALARWRRADGTVVRPLSFLAAMEEAGLVGALTDAMLQKAAACCAGWRAQGMDLSVAVNVSVRSLADPDTANRLAASVAAGGLQPRHVTLEITESAEAQETPGPVLENLARLRLRGFGLAMDDFGTGYSSLQRLGRTAFTELKIDRSLVRSAASHPPSMIIVKASLRMARDMKLVAVAEGVETAQDWQLLQGLGCDLAQGYFIAPPMEPGHVAAWTRAWTARAGGDAGEWPEDWTNAGKP